jgi:hypothetical protein
MGSRKIFVDIIPIHIFTAHERKTETITRFKNKSKKKYEESLSSGIWEV